MIKGISHSMIEVNETENDYYERAILIIRPEYASAQRAVLEDEARRLIRDMDAPSAMRSGRRRLRNILVASSLVGLGALLGGLLTSMAG